MSVMEQQPARTRRSFNDEFKRDAVAMVLDEATRSSRLPAGSGSVRARWATGSARSAPIGVSARG